MPSGIGEFYALVLLALAGMMFAASANDLVMVFVALELMAVSFYVLVSFQRSRLDSLEAGVKYLILSGVSAAVLVFGIALIFGAASGTNFAASLRRRPAPGAQPLFLLGALLVLLGLAFKIAAFPMQMWAPDVYQGAPTPVTAFLAIGSKAAGFVLVLAGAFRGRARALASLGQSAGLGGGASPFFTATLCAIPQRSLKRLLGYSSIANAGYLLLGVASLNAPGAAAVLYYLAGYAFTLAAAFVVLCLVARDSDDIAVLAGLNRRSPLLALSLTLAMVSLAGVPPLAGFLGKLFLFKAVLQRAAFDGAYWWLAFVAVAGVVISLYYYFGVIRAVYWPKETPDLTPILVSVPMRFSLGLCLAGMFYLGLFPDPVLSAATQAVQALKF